MTEGYASGSSDGITVTSNAHHFWKFVAKWGAATDDCWEWRGSLDSAGYGQWSKPRDGSAARTTVKAHRTAWAFTNGPIPKGLFICHRCDNRVCVNPAHLFLGTALDNAIDRDSKGRRRAARGEANSKAKITWEMAEKIRAAKTVRDGVAMSGLARQNVWKIRKGLSWVK